MAVKTKQNRYFELLMEAAPDSMVIVDRTGNIVMVNAQTEKLFGYERKDLIGRPVEMLMPERFQKHHLVRRSDFVTKPTARPMGAGLELYGLRRDGTEFPVEISLSPVEVDEGLVVVSAIRDITERLKIEEERLKLYREQAARAEAESANRMKDEFLVTLSHELRTPLNAILGWTHLLRSGKLDSNTSVKALETIDRNVQIQAQLIEDLLDISRIISGKLRVNSGSMQLQNVIEAAIHAIQPAAAAKSIRIVTDLDPAAGLVTGDATRIQQVVWNLLTNAVKFTPSNGRIDIKLHRAGANAEIKVSDTGKGIDPAFLPHIFDRFRQADSTTTRAHGGLGLGLAIVRHLVEIHGGTVSAESLGEGEGATFTVRLPIAEPERVRNATGPSDPEALNRLDEVRVLVVDDRADEQDLFMAILQRSGAEVHTAGSAETALEQLKRWRPDVLLTDIAMPGKDGFALLQMVRQLKADEGGLTPAIAVTAHAGQEDRERALAAGFKVYLSKPIDPQRLTEVVAMTVRPDGPSKWLH